MGTALMTEASLADWEKKYPADRLLARDVYMLEHLYAKIDYDEARAKAKYCTQWLFTRYGNTWYAKNLRQALSTTPANAAAPAPGGSAQAGSSSGASGVGSTPALGAAAPAPKVPAPKPT
jgi:hypothetical protein